jgi:hypothetical protein
MTVHSGKDRELVTPSITTTDASANGFTARTENVGHALCVDNSSPDLFDDLYAKSINCCQTVRPNRKQCLRVLDRK